MQKYKKKNFRQKFLSKVEVEVKVQMVWNQRFLIGDFSLSQKGDKVTNFSVAQ